MVREGVQGKALAVWSPAPFMVPLGTSRKDLLSTEPGWSKIWALSAQLSSISNSPGGLHKIQIPGPVPNISDAANLRWAWKSAFLTSSRIILCCQPRTTLWQLLLCTWHSRILWQVIFLPTYSPSSYWVLIRFSALCWCREYEKLAMVAYTENDPKQNHVHLQRLSWRPPDSVLNGLKWNNLGLEQ